MTVVVSIPSDAKVAICDYLLGNHGGNEAVAFAFMKHEQESGDHFFRYCDWYPVPVEGFATRSAYYVELTDDTRAAVIKRAHDSATCLVEFHTHRGPWPAVFSPSDRMGFAEFVPHVRWRLQGRPYLAIVTTKTDFDGLAWIGESARPVRLDCINVEGPVFRPTGRSPLEDTRES